MLDDGVGDSKNKIKQKDKHQNKKIKYLFKKKKSNNKKESAYPILYVEEVVEQGLEGVKRTQVKKWVVFCPEKIRGKENEKVKVEKISDLILLIGTKRIPNKIIVKN